MTVGELITELKKYPVNTLVGIYWEICEEGGIPTEIELHNFNRSLYKKCERKDDFDEYDDDENTTLPYCRGGESFEDILLENDQKQILIISG